MANQFDKDHAQKSYYEMYEPNTPEGRAAAGRNTMERESTVISHNNRAKASAAEKMGNSELVEEPA